MTIEIIDNPKELFRRWYKYPLEVLGNRDIVPDGDGGWIALSTACFLFERYVRSKYKIDQGKDKIDDEDLYTQLEKDFKTDHNTAKNFWDSVRHGLLHMGMPKQKGGPGWVIYDDLPSFKVDKTKNILFINVWKFKDRVIEILDNNPKYLEHGDYPWGHIWRKVK